MHHYDKPKSETIFLVIDTKHNFDSTKKEKEENAK